MSGISKNDFLRKVRRDGATPAVHMTLYGRPVGVMDKEELRAALTWQIHRVKQLEASRPKTLADSDKINTHRNKSRIRGFLSLLRK